MQPVRTFLRRCRELLFREKFEADMAEQIRLHLELAIEENIKQGMSPEEARYAAQRKFGGIEQVKEVAREQSGWQWLEQTWKDVRFSARTLLKSPGFTLAVVATLALCIAANAAILAAMYSLLLRPLPFREPEELVQVYNTYSKLNVPRIGASAPQYQDYKEHADLFQSFALKALWIFTIGEETEALRMHGERVSPEFFSLLGVTPFRGRFFAAEDYTPGQGRVVILTQSFWENYFHADPAVIGQEVRISSESWTVVGVAPRSVEAFDGSVVAYSPLLLPPSLNPQSRFNLGLDLYARLKPNVNFRAGLAQLETLEQRFYEQQASPPVRAHIERSGHKVALGSPRDEYVENIRTGMWLLQGGVVVVLLLGCVNATNLMLARFNARRPELSIRQALGASRLVIMRQLVIESFMMTVTGSAIGLGLAWAAVQVMNSFLGSPEGLKRKVVMDDLTFGASLAITLGAALVICAIPLLEVWREKTGPRQRTSSGVRTARGASGNRQTRALSGVLVTGQIAFALVLLICAGLLIRSFAHILAIDTGFDLKEVVSGRLQVPAAYFAPGKAAALYERILQQMRTIPGVESASLMNNVVLPQESNPAQSFILRGAIADGESQPQANVSRVTPDFFSTMGIRVVEGRAFTDADLASGRAVVIDRALAERYFPDRSAVGEALAVGVVPPKEKDWPVIVGVVEKVRLTNAADMRELPNVFVPLTTSGPVTLLLRTRRPLADVLRMAREEIRQIDRAIPFYMTGTLEMRQDYALRYRRGTMLLLAVFSSIALLLSAIGIYGLLAYDVSQRTREIGIRGAIGATRGQILALILHQGLWKAAIGTAIGLVVALFVTRCMRSLLIGIEPVDWPAYTVVSALLLAVAMLASYLPARRAAKVDPVVALRCE